MIYCDAFEGVQWTAIVFQAAGRQYRPQSHSQSIGTHRLDFICRALAHTDLTLFAVVEVISTFVKVIPVQATVLLHEKFTATSVDDVPGMFLYVTSCICTADGCTQQHDAQYNIVLTFYLYAFTQRFNVLGWSLYYILSISIYKQLFYITIKWNTIVWLELATFRVIGVSPSWVRSPELPNSVITDSLPKDEILCCYQLLTQLIVFRR